MNNNLTKNFVSISIFAGLTAVLGLVPAIQLPIIAAPITAQSLGLMLAGGILGAKRGFLSQSLFLLLVAIGLPVLAGGRGGLGIFAGPTVGYLLAWPIAAFLTGLFIEKLWDTLNIIKAFAVCTFTGIIVVYAIGTPVLAIMVGAPLEKMLIGSLVYLPGDFLKITIASFAIIAVKRSYPFIHSRQINH